MSDSNQPSSANPITPRDQVADVDHTDLFCPKFDEHGTIPAIATDAHTGEILMQAYMNREALLKTIETGNAWYWSRSRGKLWLKGETSGHIQRVVELRTDCDQDSIWIKVESQGAGACHTGHRSCYYRKLPVGPDRSSAPSPNRLVSTEERAFDPTKVYGSKH